MTEVERFPPELDGDYEKIKALGAGAMGQVFLAKDRRLGRMVAVKMMGSDQNRRTRIRFLHEAAALAKIHHPHVVKIYSYGVTETAGPYIVMELLDGAPLDKPPKGTDPLKVMLQVADGLEAIHAAELVHRDLKLPNIMLTKEGRAVIVDFGLVLDPNQTRVTKDGAFVGTFMVGAPEVLHLQAAEAATDWYSWGLNLYVLCEGGFPFTFQELLAVTERKPLPEPKFKRLDSEGRVANLIRKCLQADPALRPSSRAELSELLRPKTGGEPTKELTKHLRAQPLPPPPSLDEISAAMVSFEASRAGERSEAMSKGTSLSASTASAYVSHTGVKTGMALASAVLLIGVATRFAFDRAPLDPVGIPAPEPEALAPDLVLRLEAELDEVLSQRPALLDPDPIRYRVVLASLPELSHWRRWVEAGRDPAELPEDTRLGLASLGARFVDRGILDPFEPWVSAAPLAKPVPLPQALKINLFRDYPLPDQVSGWMGTAIVALDEAIRRHYLLDLELKNPKSPAPVGFPADLWSRRFQLFEGDLLDFARRNSHEQLFRRGLQRWFRPGVSAFTRALYAAARSVREEPETREIMALVISRLGRAISAFYYGPYNFVSLDGLLMGQPQSPAGWYMRAAATQIARDVRKRAAGTATERLSREALIAWERAARRGDRDSAMTRLRRGSAVDHLLREASSPMDAPRIHELLAEYREVILFGPDTIKVWTLAQMARLNQDAASGFELTIGEKGWIKPAFSEILEREGERAPENFRKLARDL